MRRTHSYDKAYFDEVNTSDKAYWLGFLAADGNVARNLKTITLVVHRNDRAILELFRSDLHATDIIYDYNNASRLVMQSNQMVESLSSYGIVPAKSLILAPPTLLRKDLVPHWIRGYFDGDGCISESKRGTCSTWSVVGTLAVLEWVSERLCESCDATMKIRQRRNICEGTVGSKSAIFAIRDYLYTDANEHFLARKRDKMYAVEYHKAPKIRRQNIASAMAANPDATREEIAKAAGVGVMTVYRYLRGA